MCTRLIGGAAAIGVAALANDRLLFDHDRLTDNSRFDGCSWRNRPEVTFGASSSRTESFIIAPQDGQIESVGARARVQTGQFIGVAKRIG